MASILDDLTYLEPSFDPEQITVPKLRSILVKHEVPFPSSAKKGDLVKLFNEQVAPQAPRLLKSQSRTKRSTRGIKDVPSSQASTADDYEEEAPVPPSTAKRTSRRTTRAATEEEPDRVLNTGLSATRGKTPSRTASSKHARASDPEPDGRPAARRTRHSITPAIKDESIEPEAWHLHDDVESPFTSDNPFQSGSSPPAPDPKAAVRDRRRKTLGPVEHREKRKSDVNRRRTVQPNVEQYDEGITVPTKRFFEAPLTRIKKELNEEPEAVEAGEEFTPEEQLELQLEQEATGSTDVLPRRRHKQPSQSQGLIKAGLLAMLLAMGGGFANIWRQEKLEVGYCGIGRESTSLAGVEIPEWASDILPSCEPCPPHARCYAHLRTACDPDFILKPHPLSLGGLVPLAPTCEPDSEKARRITAVADRTVEILRKRRAKYECGDLDDEGKAVTSAEIKEGDLKQEMASKRRKGMSQQEFDDLWNSAIGEMVARDEIVENTDGVSGVRSLSSTSLAFVPFGCAIRGWVRQSLERNIWKFVVVTVCAAAGFYGRYSIRYSRETEVKAKKLASDTFDRLSDHASHHNDDPGRYPELGISMTQLRDDILRNEFSSSRRQKLWEKVQQKVEHNSNVRAAVREGRSGDIARMWEWIGPVRRLEDEYGSGRRDSSRVSLGPVIGSSPPEMTPSTENSRHEMKELKTWDEGRPYY